MKNDEVQTEDFTILMAEDDEDDRFIIDQAFISSGVSGNLRFVKDGEELLDYLLCRAQYRNSGLSSWPSCILLDLNMPRKNGREALREIRNNPDLTDLSVVVLTTSDSEDDKAFCSELGVLDYITKSGDFEELIAVIKKIETLCASWLKGS